MHDGSRILSLVLRDRDGGEEAIVETPNVISSIPLPLLLRTLSPPAPDAILDCAKVLKLRSTVMVYLIIDNENLFSGQCIYINDPTIPMGRVTNFANWSTAMRSNSNQTALCCEYWCDFDSPVWSLSDEEAMAQAERDLRTAGILKQECVLDGFVKRVPRTHPMYSVESQEAQQRIAEYLTRFQNLEIIGRYGAFKYHDQDGSLYMGMTAAQRTSQRINAEPLLGK